MQCQLREIDKEEERQTQEPTTSVYTITVHDATQVVWSVRVLDSPQSSRIYLNDALHPEHNGIYALKQPIVIKDLDQFVQNNAAT
jgi:hypothetical protein